MENQTNQKLPETSEKLSAVEAAECITTSFRVRTKLNLTIDNTEYSLDLGAYTGEYGYVSEGPTIII